MKTRFALLALLFSLLWACSSPIGDGSLSRADEEYAQGNFLQAQNLYQSYLQSNPQGDKRWRVWNRLLDISLDVQNAPEKAARLLDAMLLEFSADAERSADLAWKLADVYTRMREWDKATEAWLHALSVSAENTDRLWEMYFNLGKVYQFQGRYDMARDAMNSCVENAPDNHIRATCMYELAQAYSLLKNNEQAHLWLEKVRADENAAPELKAQAVYLLAELAIAQGERETALKLFESIKDTYPNPKVVETRIQLLQ